MVNEIRKGLDKENNMSKIESVLVESLSLGIILRPAHSSDNVSTCQAADSNSRFLGVASSDDPE